jgi:hypothetical protein
LPGLDSADEQVEPEIHRGGQQFRQPPNRAPGMGRIDVVLHGLFAASLRIPVNSVGLSRFCVSANRMRPDARRVGSMSDVSIAVSCADLSGRARSAIA